MYELIIDGKKFISSSRAAKEFGYAADYIGQLARKGKLEARLVGRTWYVSPESLVEHQGHTVPDVGKTVLEKKSIPSPTLFLPTPRIESRPAEISKKALQYGLDERPLLPTLSKEGMYGFASPLQHTDISARDIAIAEAETPLSQVTAYGNMHAHSLFRTMRMLPLPFVAFLVTVSLLSANFVPLSLTVRNPAFSTAAVSSATNSGTKDTPLTASPVAFSLPAQRGIAVGKKVVHPQPHILSLQQKGKQAAVYTALASPIPEIISPQKTGKPALSQSIALSPSPRILAPQQQGKAPTANSVSVPNLLSSEKGKELSVLPPSPLILSSQQKGKTPVTVVPPPEQAVATQTSPAPEQPRIASTVQIIERAVASGLTEAYVDQKLQELNNKLQSQIYAITALSQSNTVSIGQQSVVVAQSNRIDKLNGTTLTNSTISGAHITDSSFSGSSGTFTGDVSIGGTLSVTGTTTLSSLAISGGSSVGGTFTIGTSGFVYDSTTGNVGIGTSSPYARLSVAGDVVGSSFTATSTATSTFNGKLLATFAPTIAHTFASWSIGTSGASPFDAPIVINPASATADGNLIVASVNGSPKFLVDAEGDIFVNSLTTAGSLNVATFNVSTLSVENNTTLGDAITDTTTINGTLIVAGTTTVSTVAGNFGIGTTSPYARLSVAGSSSGGTTPLLSLSTSTASATSTAFQIDSNGRVGIGTASPLYQLTVAGSGQFSSFVDAAYLVATSTTATSTFAGGLAIETNGFVYDYSSNRVGIGTAAPSASLDVAGAFTVASNGTVTLSNNTAIMAKDSGGTARNLLFADTNNLVNIGDGSTFGTIYLNGNVGIGTTSPYARLSVAGVAGGTSPLFSVSSSTSAYSTTTVFQIDSNGKVGVGTANPYAQFAVSSALISQTWSQIGNSLFISSAGTPALATLSPSRVAFIDTTNDQLRTYEFNGTTWSQVGSGLSVPNNNPAITALSPNRVAITDWSTDTLRAYEWNGTTWSAVGSSLSISDFTAYSALATLSPNRVAFIDGTNASLRTYEFNGTTWSQVGSSFSVSTMGSPRLTALSPNRIAFIDDTNDSLRTYEFNGTTWSQVGSGLSITFSGASALTTLSPNKVAFIDDTNNSLRVYEFNGTTWSQVGSGFPLTSDSSGLAALSPNRVAFIEQTNKELRTYQWSSPTFFVGGSNDSPYFAVSDSGYTTAEALSVRTGLSVGQSATSTSSTSTPALIVSGISSFLSNVGIGTTSPYANLSIGGLTGQTGPLFHVASPTGGSLFTITSAGNIGIGTTSPYATLSVVGATGVVANKYTATSTTATSTFSGLVDISRNLVVGGFSSASIFNATSTTATSTLAGGLAIETNGFVYDYSSNKVGIGTAAPSAQLHLNTIAGSSAFIVGSSTTQFIIDSLGNVGVGTSSPAWKFAVVGNGSFDGFVRSSFFTATSTTATSTFAGGLAVETNGLVYDYSSNTVGIGTAAPSAQLQINTTAGLSAFLVGSSTTQFVINSFGDVGIGTSSPSKRLSVTNTVSDSQFSLAYDATRYANFQVDSSGDLIINPSGDDVRLNDDNLYVCSGGACPAGTTVSGNGNLIVESNIGLGTSSPTQQLGVLNNIFVAGGGSPALGTATSTFSGDVKILGKLDVSTIDPVYTIDGVKYATYGVSSVGVKEETSMNIETREKNPQTGEYEYVIDFNTLPKGSNEWLFYQVTDFGENWQNLVVTLTPGFNGTVHYTKDARRGKLTISSTAAGEVAVRLISNRFDSAEWPNIRPDQSDPWTHFILTAKKIMGGERE